jgi:D-beta-D-heptose 7-phosphate kinase/D-beta-D-heptose 1-phosphate adenosyltransferase
MDGGAAFAHAKEGCMASHELLTTLDNLPRTRVLVLGDLVLDRYTWGNVDRVSPEAPVMVLQADRRESRLGGAANVAHMLQGLGASATCIGVIGNDSDGQLLRDLMLDAGIDAELALTDPSRPTTTKERFIGRAATRHPSQILRVDSEDRTPLSQRLEDAIIAHVARDITQFDMLLISDYGKGVCTPRVLEAVINAARSAEIPVIVDPIRASDWNRYRGATLVKANRHETETVAGTKFLDPRESLTFGRKLCQLYDLQSVVVTLDRDGMAVVRRDGTGDTFPTTARNIYDITGAGDLVMAVFGMCLASRVSLETTAQLANIAAGLKVERFGASVVTREEIRNEIIAQQMPGVRKIVTLQQAVAKIEEHRRRGETLAMTNGCFDLLHVGHVASLNEAGQHGDVLLVAINSDSSVRRLKGPQRPVISETDRAAMLAALDCVDYVIVFDDDTPHALLHALKPEVLVKGGTYRPEDVVGHEVVASYGGKVMLTGVVEGISTTNILKSLEATGLPREAIAGMVTAHKATPPLPTQKRQAG